VQELQKENIKSEFVDRAQKLANSALNFENGKFELEALTAQLAEKKPDLDRQEALVL
jgi:hypothetical protein